MKKKQVNKQIKLSELLNWMQALGPVLGAKETATPQIICASDEAWVFKSALIATDVQRQTYQGERLLAIWASPILASWQVLLECFDHWPALIATKKSTDILHYCIIIPVIQSF